MSNRNPITQRAIDKAGGPTKISPEIGTSPQNISMWKRIPTKWCDKISQMSGIPMHELRPDVFTNPEERSVA